MKPFDAGAVHQASKKAGTEQENVAHWAEAQDQVQVAPDAVIKKSSIESVDSETLETLALLRRKPLTAPRSSLG
jgi:hypothetical protein